MRSILILFILGSALSANAQLFGKKWADGKLYHTSGEVFTGQISWSPPDRSQYREEGDQVFYRRDNKSEPYPIPSFKIQSFVMGEDSFVVSHNQDFKNTPFFTVKLNAPTKVFTLLTHKQGIPMMFGGGSFGGPVSIGVGLGANIGGGTKKTYYYGANADNVTKLEKKQFMDVMSNVMADKPEVVAKIKDKTFKYGDMDDLLEFYKTGQMPKKGGYDN